LFGGAAEPLAKQNFATRFAGVRIYAIGQEG